MLAQTYPAAVRALVAELKHRLRLHLIRHEGEKATQEFIHEFWDKAISDGFDDELVDEVINMHKHEAVKRLGSKHADARLGKPTPLERFS